MLLDQSKQLLAFSFTSNHETMKHVTPKINKYPDMTVGTAPLQMKPLNH